MPPKPELTLIVKRVLKSGVKIVIPAPLLNTWWPRCPPWGPVTLKPRPVRSYVKLLDGGRSAELVIKEEPVERRTTDSPSRGKATKKKKKKTTMG
jgi:hypothetical protein